MLNKNFFKTLVRFLWLILIGMVAIYAIDYFDAGNDFQAEEIKNNPVSIPKSATPENQ